MKRRLVLLGLLFTFLSAGWVVRACSVTGTIDPADKAWAEGLVSEVKEEVQAAVQTVTTKADNVEQKIDGVDETIGGLKVAIEELNARLKALRDELRKFNGGE